MSGAQPQKLASKQAKIDELSQQPAENTKQARLSIDQPQEQDDDAPILRAWADGATVGLVFLLKHVWMRHDD